MRMYVMYIEKLLKSNNEIPAGKYKLQYNLKGYFIIKRSMCAFFY